MITTTATIYPTLHPEDIMEFSSNNTSSADDYAAELAKVGSDYGPAGIAALWQESEHRRMRAEKAEQQLEEERQKAHRTGTLEERANIVAWLHKWAHNARAAGGFGKIGSSVLHEVAAQIEARP